ncbi:MAG TPA: M56 family metallopeptidase [Chroococcidiopsis sp.]
MHIGLIGLALVLAVIVRSSWSPATVDSWEQRWQRALGALLSPFLLLLATAIAVLQMGHHGQMMGMPVGRIGCLIALGFLGSGLVLVVVLAALGWRSRHRVSTYPTVAASGQMARLLDIDALFAGQVGFWTPTLIVSRGLLHKLSAEQIAAVLTHEQAHYYYRDPFWFFWLGWVRRFTAWLPNTAALWEELLVLRELRADRWAAQTVDPLLLAESLLQVVQSQVVQSAATVPAHSYSVAFGGAEPLTRLEERIDALLEPGDRPLVAAPALQWRAWAGLLIGLLPLLTLPLHS